MIPRQRKGEMRDEQSYTETPEQRRINQRRMKIADTKYKIWFFFRYSVWQNLINVLGLTHVHGKTLCKLNLYRKYPDGRCHWCGNNHKVKL